MKNARTSVGAQRRLVTVAIVLVAVAAMAVMFASLALATGAVGRAPGAAIAAVETSYTIVPSAGAHGSISPDSTETVDAGQSLTCTFTPEAGYHVATLTVDTTATAYSARTYTFTNVAANHTIHVDFAADTSHTIVPSAGAHGQITPDTTQTVGYGTDKTFTFAPATGYRVATLTVDSSVIATTATSYTFTNVTTDHAIGVSFAAVVQGPPVTTISGVPAGWTSSDVTFTLSATGTAPPLTTFYKLGAGATTTYTAPVGGFAEGTTVVNYWSVDGNGAESTKTATVRIDKTAPLTSSDAKPSYVGPATIAVSAVDTMSGVASIWYSVNGTAPAAYTAPVVLPTPGDYTFSFGSVDNAGNRSATQTASFTISPGGATQQVFAGEDRYETAVLASRSQFATGTVGTVIIATGENFPDALSAGPLAGAYGSPVLLTRYNGLPTVVAEEIARLGATHAIIIGGTGVVLPQVQTEIESIVTSHTVSRLSGSDRYGTAAVVAEAVKAKVGPAWDGTVYVATGTNFPDALSAGPNAYHKTRPILLVKGATIPAATANAVASLLPVQGAILGGVGVIPSSTVDALFTHGQDIVRLGGANRYETAVDVAAWSAATEGQSWSVLGIATGQSFADALSGGAVIGKQGGVMLLTMPTSLPEPTATTIAEQVDDIQTVEFFGGDGAVSPAVRAQIMGLLP